MQILRLVLVTLLSKYLRLTFLFFLWFQAQSQVQNNSIVQKKSPNANTQVGNNNTNKQDNRKTYHIKKENNNENIFSGPLFTGENPYVTINNIAPNIDSIKYEIELKKKNIRIGLSKFLLQGDTLKKRCVDISDTNLIKLDLDISSWLLNTEKFLNTNLDLSYSTLFLIPLVHFGITPEETGDGKRIELWRKVYYRLERLDSFITSLF